MTLTPPQTLPPAPANGPAPAKAPRDGVRSLLVIALAWTLAATGLVVVVAPQARVAAEDFGAQAGELDGETFTIKSIGGEKPDPTGDGIYTVGRNPVVIAVELHEQARVECWNYSFNGGDDVSAADGTWTLEVPVMLGENEIECYTGADFGQWVSFWVDLDPSGTPGAAQTPAAYESPSADPTASFRVIDVNGVAPLDGGTSFRLHQAAADITIEITGTTTVACENYDTGEEHSVGGMPGMWWLGLDLQAGANRIRCRMPEDASSAVDLVLTYDTSPAATPEPGKVVITRVDGIDRADIPGDTYQAPTGQIVIRGSAPDPKAVVCEGDACAGATVYATSATEWSVQINLSDGPTTVVFHDRDHPANKDSITVELTY